MQGYRKPLCVTALMLAIVLCASVLAQGLATQGRVTMPSSEPWYTAQFKDQNGDVFSFQDVGSKPIILSFAFTGCSVYCPAQAIELKFLQDELNAAIGADAYQIISVSLTPVYDQPADMQRFADRFQVDFTNWRFLTGSQEGTESLIISTGIEIIRYTGDTVPDLDHTTSVYLLNAQGRIVEKFNGIPLDKGYLKAALFKLLDTQSDVAS